MNNILFTIIFLSLGDSEFSTQQCHSHALDGGPKEHHWPHCDITELADNALPPRCSELSIALAAFIKMWWLASHASEEACAILHAPRFVASCDWGDLASG